VLALPDEPKDGLDRRDFIITTIASGAAAATLAATASNATAEGAAAPTAGSVRNAPQGTVYTGDVIHGKKVISALDDTRCYLTHG
jgi:hypothetical protein